MEWIKWVHRVSNKKILTRVKKSGHFAYNPEEEEKTQWRE